jgi:alkanesulfonate monooxygenase SsuD/methylene tetrahydromethanopterin reductase-like flavin-dependent oxidoreductase (luciferase family)
MKFGLCLPIRLYADARSNVEVAVAAEKAGFDSVWASDHVIVPVKRAGMFSEYFCDPFVLLAYIAARTSGIRIGTSVIILTEIRLLPPRWQRLSMCCRAGE